MKSIRSMLTVLFIPMFALINYVPAYAQNYLGDVCWRVMANEETEEAESIVKLDGTYEGIGTIYDKHSEEIQTGVQSGTLTLIVCPE